MKKLLSLIVAIIFAANSFAQANEVTLTVIGTGENEEKATLQALRSAIEQTFGAFVSANTTILNDEIVQDEIVSISTGNVTKYEKNAVVTLPNGHVSVSLNATIAINKLISYAQSKGAKAEFAGSTYATNAKLLRLKIQSIEKAYEIMVQQMEEIATEMYTFDLTIGEPKRVSNMYSFDCVVNVYSNIASNNFRNLFIRTMKEFKLNESEVKLCSQEDISLCSYNSYFGTINGDNSEIYRAAEEKVYTQYGSYDYGASNRKTREKIEKQTLILPYFNSKFQLRILDALYNARWKYSIQEINNSKNVFTPTEESLRYPYHPDDNDRHSFMFTLEELEELEELDIKSYRYIGMNENRRVSVQSSDKPMKGTMAPSNLSCSVLVTPMHKKRLKYLEDYHGIKGVTHDAKVKGSKIESHHFTLTISADNMTHFQGFELINVSAPNESFFVALPKEYRKTEGRVKPEVICNIVH